MNRRTLRSTWAHRGDESGSMPLALLASIVVAALITIVTSTTIAGQRSARADRDWTAVIQAADAGVQQALYQLNASFRPDGDRLPATGDVAGTLGAASFTWYAERIGDTREWEVYAEGTLNGKSRRVVATVEENRRFFASAFGNLLAGFSNNNVSDTFNSGADGNPTHWPRPGRLGLVGSNNVIDTGGSSSTLDGIQLWDWKPDQDHATQFTARCKGNGVIGLTRTSASAVPGYDPPELRGCASEALVRPANSFYGPYTQTINEKRVLSPTAEALREKLAACGDARPLPNFDNTTSGPTELSPVTATVATTTGNTLNQPRVVPPQGSHVDNTFEPGYYCYNNVTFGRDTTLAPGSDATDMVNNPVVIVATGRVELAGSGASSARKVNCSALPSPNLLGLGDCPGTSGNPPIAGALQIYLVKDHKVASPATPEFQQNAPSSYFGGAVYGVDAHCGNPGSAQAEVYGSLICDQINNVGGWKFHFDASLETLGNSVFTLKRWQER
ncbi:MAG: hypothetical protein KY462_11220 [Actinobacteria bacterium]|nr:hypothetical protein [Actinomycetota bacterium]